MMPQAAYFVSFYPGASGGRRPAFPGRSLRAGGHESAAAGCRSGAPPLCSPLALSRHYRFGALLVPQARVRFNYPGKAKQILLFRELGVRHPESLLFQDPLELMEVFSRCGSPWGYPLVLKGDLGGGGSNVYPIYQASDVACYAPRLAQNQPALLQRWVDHRGKDLRVVVYGDLAVSYFRVGDGGFYNNVCRGGPH